MSGHKRATITISEGEYRRLHDAEIRLRFTPQPSVESSWPVTEQVNRALQGHLGQLEERQRQFERTVCNFQQEVQTAEMDTMRQYLQRETELYTRLWSQSERRLDATQSALREQASQFSSLLEEQQRRHQENILNLQIHQQAQLSRLEDQVQTGMALLEQRLDSVLDEQERKYLAAGNWIAQARELAQFIQERYAHEAYLPGELVRLEQAVALAEANLAENMPEAAVVSGQQAYVELSGLHLQLEQLDSEWRLLAETCWENASRLLAFAEENRTCPAHDLDGNQLPEMIDVDFWTEGDLEQQIESLRDLAADLGERAEGFDLPALRVLAEEDLPRRYERLSETVYQARLAVLNSQLRINIADLVVQALEQQGFGLVQSEYADCDQRNGFSAKVRNREKDEIVIQVAPDPGILGKNELHLISLDRARRDERELVGRSREVALALDRYGLEVGEMRASHSRPPRESATPNRRSIQHRQSHPNSR